MMKKALLVVLALLLALPAVSFAGSATSRWDMTLGGFVKTDIVYNSKAGGGVDVGAAPKSSGTQEVLADKSSNLTWGSVETRLNWAIKGPEAMGAKTAAFVEGEFRGTTWSQQGGSFIGQQGGNPNANLVTGAGTAASPYAIQTGGGGTGTYGLFALRHAYMQLIWPKTTLLIGHTFQAWGTIPSLMILGLGENHMNKGWTRVPQIRLTQAFTKNFTGVFAVQAPYDTLTQQNANVNPGANSLVPDLVADFAYASDACGKIGAFNMKFGLGGFWGQDKFYYTNATAGATTALGSTVGAGNIAANGYSNQTIDKWGAGFYWYVPIIPEKKGGNRTGALAFTGQLYAGQGLGLPTPRYPGSQGTVSWANGAGAYTRSPFGAFQTNSAFAAGVTPDGKYLTAAGGWAQATFFLSEKWFVNGLYGLHKNNLSDAYINSGAFSNNLRWIQNYIFNVMYEPNAAIRLAVEWYHVDNVYAYRGGPGTATNPHNSEDTFRFAGYYYF